MKTKEENIRVIRPLTSVYPKVSFGESIHANKDGDMSRVFTFVTNLLKDGSYEEFRLDYEFSSESSETENILEALNMLHQRVSELNNLS